VKICSVSIHPAEIAIFAFWSAILGQRDNLFVICRLDVWAFGRLAHYLLIKGIGGVPWSTS
jgi:hypothetical protein